MGEAGSDGEHIQRIYVAEWVELDPSGNDPHHKYGAECLYRAGREQ